LEKYASCVFLDVGDNAECHWALTDALDAVLVVGHPVAVFAKIRAFWKAQCQSLKSENVHAYIRWLHIAHRVFHIALSGKCILDDTHCGVHVIESIGHVRNIMIDRFG
jgi:hypothetical protein